MAKQYDDPKPPWGMITTDEGMRYIDAAIITFLVLIPLLGLLPKRTAEVGDDKSPTPAASTPALSQNTTRPGLPAIEQDRAFSQVTITRSQLEADFIRDRREIDSSLSPLISQTIHWAHEKYPRFKGASLTHLKITGALEQSERGNQQLKVFIRDHGNPNRPGLNTTTTSPTTNQAFEEYQLNRKRALLMKYGPLMVERGMLQP